MREPFLVPERRDEVHIAAVPGVYLSHRLDVEMVVVVVAYEHDVDFW